MSRRGRKGRKRTPGSGPQARRGRGPGGRRSRGTESRAGSRAGSRSSGPARVAHPSGSTRSPRAGLQRLGALFQRYRILFVIYGVGAAVGLREFQLARTTEPVDWGSDRWAEMTSVMEQVNPDDPDTDFLEGVQSIVQGDEGGFVTHFEDALEADVKHNEFLLRDYAQHLLESGADWRQVNDAVNRWRENYPFTNETLTLELGAGPRTQADVSVLTRELYAVPWIADAELEPYEANGQRGWRVHITFRPPRPVDMREAVAAVSILSVPEADRVRLSVNCATLTDCTVAPRSNR